tara:strand:+ start:3750 stop:4043 length:294 start_codon:yes stop_codon:yes gene_type:complete
MARRYGRNFLIAGGKGLSTSKTLPQLRLAYEQGKIKTRTEVSRDGDRLDILAGRYYGDASKWWVIAALSGIGWSLQVPPGTRLIIPLDMQQIKGYVG